MKTLNLLSASLVLSLLALTACNSESPISQSPPETYSSESMKVELSTEETQPKLDILFVIDNSNSMKEEQVRLAKNIQYFVEEFATKAEIDFHIGVVSVFDSTRQDPDRWPDQRIFASGELRPLKDPQSGSIMTDLPPYVSKDVPNYIDVLASTLTLGIHKLDDGGPLYEESFTPVVSALSEPMNTGPNKGFLRPDSHVAVVMITDADDASPELSASGLDHFLRNLRGEDDFDRETFSTYAVLSPPDDESCERDDSGAPEKILSFIDVTYGKWFSLCDPQFGEKLGEIGSHLAQRVSIKKVIPLNHIPEIKTLQVSIEGEPLANDKGNGWLYDPDQVALVLRSPAGGYLQHSQNVEINYVPAKMKNLVNGRSFRLGQ